MQSTVTLLRGVRFGNKTGAMWGRCEGTKKGFHLGGVKRAQPKMASFLGGTLRGQKRHPFGGHYEGSVLGAKRLPFGGGVAGTMGGVTRDLF